MKSKADLLKIVLFVLTLLLPTLDLFFHLDPSRRQTENRVLAPMPTLPRGLDALNRFPAEFEKYYSDNFGFRSPMIRIYGLLKIRLLNSSSSPSVVLGREGWLFFTGEQNIEGYSNINPFTEAELAAWESRVRERDRAMRAKGIRYLLVIAPNPQTIYPEFLPRWVKKVRPGSRLDQLIDRLKGPLGDRMVDLRPALLAAKAGGKQVYRKTDTHWTDWGAYAAYSEIMKRLDMAPEPLSQFHEVMISEEGGDLAAVLGLKESVWEEYPTLVPNRARAAQGKDPHNPMVPFAMENRGGPKRRLTLFHDSFADAVYPFLAEHFAHVGLYHQLGFDPSIVAREQPDVVIHEVVERYLIFGPDRF